ncbi:restriction endonuclease subunit S [Legionella pneumophila]|uniref:restriction endonuclease subunit S n=1 Tax=Legionella pneumophila TaxID=446 RepID=UPI0010AA8702|nr:restriction endonuclease subunit S [Legionella pneumophila]TIE08666.1 hypothetical protein DIZ56_16975 [Legionella pneumophila]
MQYQLDELSKLFPGVSNKVYSEKEIPNSKQVFLLKGNNLDHEGNVVLDESTTVYIDEEKLDQLLLKENDLLILARGSAIRGGIVTQKLSQLKVTANSNFIVIRPDQSKIRSEILVAFLNSEYGHNQLVGLSKGAVIQHIPFAELKKLKVSVPNNEIQNRIAEIYHAAKEAQETTKELLKQQKQTSNAIMLNLMYGVA